MSFRGSGGGLGFRVVGAMFGSFRKLGVPYLGSLQQGPYYLGRYIRVPYFGNSRLGICKMDLGLVGFDCTIHGLSR